MESWNQSYQAPPRKPWDARAMRFHERWDISTVLRHMSFRSSVTALVCPSHHSSFRLGMWTAGSWGGRPSKSPSNREWCSASKRSSPARVSGSQDLSGISLSPAPAQSYWKRRQCFSGRRGTRGSITHRKRRGVRRYPRGDHLLRDDRDGSTLGAVTWRARDDARVLPALCTTAREASPTGADR